MMPSELTPPPETCADDARLYSLVHDALENGLRGDLERRDDRRGEFACVQLVAPYAGGDLPDQGEFRHVECRDLSTRGFSFVTQRRPPARQLVVALGRAPFHFFLADIVHCAPDLTHERVAYRVGCQFRKRIER